MSIEITTTSAAIELSEQELDAVAGGRMRPYSPKDPIPFRPKPSFPLFPGFHIRPVNWR